ncbi:MAG: uracil-DNA glycosylase [Verrucomicrobiota bacterium]|nr:uracil-DNA glycosylase [Verrucomicrobiota bacterium]
MPSEYDELLDATISHLHRLKKRGKRWITVDAAILGRVSGKEVEISKPAVKAVTPVKTGEVRQSPSASMTTPPVPAKGSRVAVPERLGIENKGESPGNRREALEQLRSRALVCVKCPHLAATRTNVVFGVGDIEARLMFVGEAPGADEDAEGEPFVGRAGQLLTKIIVAMGLTRETVYIANILKCRPDTPGQTAGNRRPTPEEIKTCLPYLNAQIDLIQPKVIVALGSTAVEGLFGKSEAISKLRGNYLNFRNIPVMPTFHPSYLLRPNGFAAKPLVWQDMMSVMETLGMEISEKQRGYFKAG